MRALLLLCSLVVFTANAIPLRGVIAHRGASASHPENTLVGIREAIRLGAHGVEIDVRETRDGHLVLMHDKSVSRTTDGAGIVSDLTLDEIKKLDAGSWKGPAFQGEKVPTLEEALSIIPAHVFVSIDTKIESVVLKAAQTVSRLGMQGHALIGSPKAVIAKVKSIDSRLMVVNMTREMFNSTYVEQSIKHGASFLQFKDLWPAPNANDIKKAAAAGVMTNYCCTDDAKEMDRLYSRGVNFILANDIVAALEALKSHP